MVRGVGERVLGRLFGGGGVGVGVRGWWWVFGVGMWLEGGLLEGGWDELEGGSRVGGS